MISNSELVIPILDRRVTPAEWNLSTLNCYRRKGDFLERGNYRAMKITVQILKIAEKIIEKLIRQKTDIEEIQFSVMPRCGTTSALFILRQLQ